MITSTTKYTVKQLMAMLRTGEWFHLDELLGCDPIEDNVKEVLAVLYWAGVIRRRESEDVPQYQIVSNSTVAPLNEVT